MTFDLAPKPARRKRGAAYFVGYISTLVIALSALGIIVAAAIAAIRWILGA